MERKYLYIKKKCGVDIYIYKNISTIYKIELFSKKAKNNLYKHIYIYIYKNV